MDAEVLARLSRGDEVEKTRFNDDWTEVEFRGQTGYVSSEYLVSKEEKETAGEESTAQQNTGGHIIAIDALVDDEAHQHRDDHLADNLAQHADWGQNRCQLIFLNLF